MPFVIRKLAPDDAAPFMALRRRALEQEPLAFAASPEDDVGLSEDFVRRSLQEPTQAIFGAFDPELLGVVGIARDRKLKAAHKAQVGGMYVVPAARGQGIGRALMEAAIELARRMPGVEQVHLGVSDRAIEAEALYLDLGFVVWGVERGALRVGGELVSERHMVLQLAGQRDRAT